MTSGLIKDSYDLNLARQLVRDLVLILSEAATKDLSKKEGIPKNFAIFTGKHLYQSLFLSCNFI